jgi:hypothetical protein
MASRRTVTRFLTYAAASPGSTLDLNAWIGGAPAGTCFHADDAAIAAGS